MSFFSSFVANVTSGVANLGLNSRRFSLSRQESNEAQDGSAKPATTPSITVSPASNLSTQHGERALLKGFKFLSRFYPSPSSLNEQHFESKQASIVPDLD